MAQADDPAAGPVWLDLEHERLRRGEKPLHLRPKTFALPRHPVAHPGRVLSKGELMEAVWPKTAISDGVLMVSSNEVRQALGDMAQAPQYLDVLWRRRSLPAGPGGPGAALPRDGWCAAGRMAGAARPDLLVQMPALLAADALEAVQRRVLGATGRDDCARVTFFAKGCRCPRAVVCERSLSVRFCGSAPICCARRRPCF
jgi:hypothetical protein